MTVSDEKLATALQAAAVLALGRPECLPLYERLESEVLSRRARADVLSRARMVAKGVQHYVLPTV